MWRGALAALLVGLALVSCGEADAPPPTPSPTPTVVATVAPTPTPEPAVLLDEAYVLLRSGRHAEAADAFAAIAERATDPQDRSTARLGEAVAVYEMGAHGRSLSLLRQAFAAATHGSPEEARAVYLLGVRLNEARAFEEAVALLRPHAVLGTGLALAPSIVSEYARALAGNGDVERAETVWQSLLATPGLGEQLRLPILRQRASIARVQDDLEGRRRWLGQLAALTGDPEVRHELAAVGFLLGDLDLFEAQLRAIIAESPWTEEALFSVRDLRQAGYEVDPGDEGYVYYRHRAFTQARTVLLQAVQDPLISGEALAYRTYFFAASYDDDGYNLEAIALYDARGGDPGGGGLRASGAVLGGAGARKRGALHRGSAALRRGCGGGRVRIRR